MKTIADYKFEVSISDQSFDHKPDKDTEVPDITFTKKTVDVTGFCEYMLEGHCYAPVFASDTFSMTDRSNKNFRYSYLVSVDVDHSQETMTEMVDRLEFKPTCAYTSTRNGLNGENRFRLVYCFEDRIEELDEYRELVYAIFDANKLDLNEKVNGEDKYDPQTKAPSQIYFGNGTDTFEFTVTDIIYCKDDFNIYFYIDNNKINNSNILYNNEFVNKNYTYTPTTTNIHLDDKFEDNQFQSDFWNMKIEDILEKYIYTYPNLERTPLEIPDDDTPVIMLPPNYVEINRVGKAGKTGKYVRVKAGTPIKIKDGQGRRRTLFWNGILRRLINPSISFDNLVYNLLFELCYYITNYEAKNVIGKRDIYQIAKSVMKQDMTKYQYLTGTDKEYSANQNDCIKYNVTPNQATKIYRGMVTAARIGELYDCSKSDKENLEVMKKNGLEIHQSTLSRWKKTNGLSRDYKKNHS